LQNTSAPAARSRRTSSASPAAGPGTPASEALVVTTPATSTLSLTATGASASGPDSARAGAAITEITAFSGSPSRPIRS
jgi:hypothetical protein